MPLLLLPKMVAETFATKIHLGRVFTFLCALIMVYTELAGHSIGYMRSTLVSPVQVNIHATYVWGDVGLAEAQVPIMES